MLRQRQLIRMQIHQLMDACLIAIGFWIAFEIRASPWVINLLGLGAAPPEDAYVWIFLLLIPASPIVLEWQGFYSRPFAAPRRFLLLPLLRACVIITILLILLLYFFQITFARPVVISFSFIAFALVYVKEEILRQNQETLHGLHED